MLTLQIIIYFLLICQSLKSYTGNVHLLYRDAIPSVESSALCVLSLQPVFVEHDGGKCFFPNTSSARCLF
jgi:hypothetical protein